MEFLDDTENDEYYDEYDLIDSLDYERANGSLNFMLLVSGEIMATLYDVDDYSEETDFLERISNEINLLSDKYDELVNNLPEDTRFMIDDGPDWDFYEGEALVKDKKEYNHLIFKTISGKSSVIYKITDLGKKKLNHPQCNPKLNLGDELKITKGSELYNFIELLIYKFRQLENAYYNVYLKYQKIEGEKNNTSVKMKFNKEKYSKNYNKNSLIYSLEYDRDLENNKKRRMKYYGFGKFYAKNNDFQSIASLTGIKSDSDEWEFLTEVGEWIRYFYNRYEELLIDSPYDIREKLGINYTGEFTDGSSKLFNKGNKKFPHFIKRTNYGKTVTYSIYYPYNHNGFKLKNVEKDSELYKFLEFVK